MFEDIKTFDIFFMTVNIQQMNFSIESGNENEAEKIRSDLEQHLIDPRYSGENLEEMSLSTEEIINTITKWRRNSFRSIPREEFLAILEMATLNYGGGFKNNKEWRKALSEINLDEIDAKRPTPEIDTPEKINEVLTPVE